MPALGAGIYVFCTMEFKGVDGRTSQDKPGMTRTVSSQFSPARSATAFPVSA
jgi:hypothetical protein